MQVVGASCVGSALGGLLAPMGPLQRQSHAEAMVLRVVHDLAGADALHSDCLKLVGHVDHRIQAMALDVITRWSYPAIRHYKKQLGGLINEKSFRETLTMFAVDRQLDHAMAESHRPSVLPLLTTLLYSKLTQRSGRGGSKSMMSQRRATTARRRQSYAPSIRHRCGHTLARSHHCSQPPISAPRCDNRKIAATARNETAEAHGSQQIAQP